MTTKLQTLIIRLADFGPQNMRYQLALRHGINSPPVMGSTRPNDPMASTSRNACINSPHVMVSTHLESWYQFAPLASTSHNAGINSPQVMVSTCPKSN